MRTVLYTDDMEPITVLDLKPWAMEYLVEHGNVRLPVMRPISTMWHAEHFDGTTPIMQVTIYAERFVRNGKKHMMLFTSDEETALLLRAAFLPGQQNEVNRRMDDAYAKGVKSGFLTALDMLGR